MLLHKLVLPSILLLTVGCSSSGNTGGGSSGNTGGGSGLSTAANDGQGMDSGGVDDAFSRARLVFAVDLDIDGADQLYSMNPDGSDLVRLQSDKPGVEPAVSPDGRWVAFSISDIRIIDSDDEGEDRVLTFPDLIGGSYDSFPAWSPDSTELAFVRFSPLNAPAIFRINKATGVVSFVTAAGEQNNWEVFGLDWSPDGQTLIWGAWDPLGVGNFSAIRLLTAPADGSRAGVYLVDGSTPEYRADSTALVWVSSIGQITLGNTGAVGGIRIGEGREPAWSPDGSQVVFQSDDQSSLNVYNSSDGSITPILNTLGKNIRGIDWALIQ